MPPAAQPLVSKPQALRYRRGKLPPGAAPPPDSDTDTDASYSGDERRGRGDGDGVKVELVAGGAGRVIQSDQVGKPKGKGKGKGKEIQVALRDVKVEESGEVWVGGKREVGRTEREAESSGEESEDDDVPSHSIPNSAFSKPTIVKAEASSSGEYETDSEESESEEEENPPPKPTYRPTFVPKRARETVLEKQALAQQAEIAEQKRLEELDMRKKESRELVGETIRREMAEREAPDLIPDVDDSDDLDPESEFQSWRLRELSRLARDKERTFTLEEERIEIERRRALPAAQRDAEDEEYARKTREDAREGRGERAFLEKFWHKGAFHQDEEILKRNYNVKLESTVDVSLLPKVMQVRNFGKMSQTKYTHLKDQDTTQDGWGTAARPGHGGPSMTEQGCFNCGGPHLRRDCPNPPQQGSGPPGTGTNNSTLGSGSRSWGGPAGVNDGRHHGDYPSDRDRGLDYSGSGRRRDRSSPPRRDGRDDRRREDHGDRRRSRSRSPERGERRRDDRERRR